MHRISLVMPIYKTEQFLSKAIESIIDQDYNDWELICVMDGYTRKAAEIIRSFKDKRVKELSIEHGGVCRARNEGAKIATGEYVSFFSSDFQAVPGMLRKWITELEEHPDCDFVYGGYLFPDKKCYPSEEFSPRQLEVYNYIDGGFPVKRELWEKYPWEEKIKSLNDWNFWLKIVKAGHKGYFMDGYFSYVAEYPRIGGLSNDSSMHWIERAQAVKENNGIPQRDIVVTSLGAPFFGKRVAELLDADYHPMPQMKPHEYKMVYLLGFYIQAADQHSRVFTNNLLPDCKKVVHWVGTDIMQLAELPFKTLKPFVEVMNKTTIMLCESEAKQKELSDMGLIAEVLPVLRDISKFTVKPFPKQFAVAVYHPDNNQFLYNLQLMESIIKNMPDVKFYFFGNKQEIKSGYKNLEILGWKDINDVIDKSSVLLRYTVHDGLPTTPMEFVMSGRYVITNAEMGFVDHVPGNSDTEGIRKEIIEKIREVKKRCKKGELPSPTGREFYREYLNPDKIKERLRKIADEV